MKFNSTILIRSDVIIPKRHLRAAYEALLSAAEANPSRVNHPDLSTLRHAGELKLALGSYGLYPEEATDGSLLNLRYREGRDEAVIHEALMAIGPFVKTGRSVVFANETGDIFRYYYDGTKAHHQVEGRLVFDPAAEAPMSLPPPDRLSEVAPEPRPWLTQAGTQAPDEPMGSGMTLRRHAEFGDAALHPYATRTGLTLPDEYEEAVKDSLGDIMHVCDREGLDFEEMLASAQARYSEEIDGDG